MTVSYEIKTGKNGGKYVLVTFTYNDYVVKKVVFLSDLEKQVLGVK